MIRKRKTKNPCVTCLLHQDRCICHLIPKIITSTKLSLVIHHRELKRTTNTGTLAVHALVNSEIFIRGQENNILDLSKILSDDYETYVFFPSEDAQDIESLKPSKPVQLIVSDGNWRQAGKLHRRQPELKNLPRVCINEINQGTQHLRKEHTSHGFSTLQAIALAYGHLEGQAVKDQLLQLYQAKLSATMIGRGIKQ